MEELKQYTVFYSWQSDNPQSRRIINNVLNKAKKALASKEQPIDIIIDQGTDMVPGSKDRGTVL